jgi:hypothetical protein
MPMSMTNTKKKPLSQFRGLEAISGDDSRTATVTPRGPGRPPKEGAKRSSAEYQQKTIFLPKQEYGEAQVRLLQSNLANNEDRKMSDLLSDLLVKWVNEQK